MTFPEMLATYITIDDDIRSFLNTQTEKKYLWKKEPLSANSLQYMTAKEKYIQLLEEVCNLYSLKTAVFIW